MRNTVMTPRTMTALTQALTAHAAWCHTGKVQANGRSILARLMESKGQFVLGSSLAACPLEEKIEGAVMRLAVQNLRAADVLRLEHGAGWMNVVKRRNPKLRNWLWSAASQDQKAQALGLKGWEYRVLLAAAHQFILEELTK